MSFVEDSIRRTASKLFAIDGGAVPLTKLCELGWDELVASQPKEAITIMAEMQGRHRGTSRLVELELGRPLGIQFDTEGLAFVLNGPSARGDAVDLVLVGDAAELSEVVIPIERDDVSLRRVPVSDFDAVAVKGVDPSCGWLRLRGEIGNADGELIERSTWQNSVASGRLVLAYELIGLGSAMLEIAVLYVSEREQFGVPIGTFQAVQHRMADVLVGLEAARTIADTCWNERQYSLCAAALIAARSAVWGSIRDCQQVMGAIGCTWEHPLHRFVRRGILLSLLLDVGSEMESTLIDAVVSTYRVDVFA